MAIENCLVFERLMGSHSTIDKANTRVTQLLAINRELTREPRLRRMTAAVRRHALRLTRAEECELFMIDAEGKEMMADSSNATKYNIAWLRRSAPLGVSDPIYLAAETAETGETQRLAADASKQQKALLCVALQSSRTQVVIAVLAVLRKRDFEQEDVETLKTVSYTHLTLPTTLSV